MHLGGGTIEGVGHHQEGVRPHCEELPVVGTGCGNGLIGFKELDAGVPPVDHAVDVVVVPWNQGQSWGRGAVPCGSPLLAGPGLARAPTAARRIPCVPKSLPYRDAQAASVPQPLSPYGHKKKTAGRLDLPPPEPYAPPASLSSALANLLPPPSLCLELLLPHGAPPRKSSMNTAPLVCLSPDILWKPSPMMPFGEGLPHDAPRMHLLWCSLEHISLVMLPGSPPL